MLEDDDVMLAEVRRVMQERSLDEVSAALMLLAENDEAKTVAAKVVRVPQDELDAELDEKTSQDVTTHEDLPGLVMEYLPPGSLRHFLDDTPKTINNTQHRDWADQIAHGMAYIQDHDTEDRSTALHTAPFMAPELLDSNAFTELSGVYSYAMVLHKILA
ncbi:hypothetical protein CTAYLR_005617 [Chrysophaeum taylorii]|uniref:Serine-threonine/tyrosine-protein kinase catalytic domain-containing protein n=1 Tax=Chrysophaeum taylorii TaxID=2483200 RepID=A0AAD7UA79_9STRA|nr:hypothetical protein CTAYLR_005617 [Chrysophaeum taylorii]